MQYFNENKDKKMTWSALLFDDEKGLMGEVEKLTPQTIRVIVKKIFVIFFGRYVRCS